MGTDEEDAGGAGAEDNPFESGRLGLRLLPAPRLDDEPTWSLPRDTERLANEIELRRAVLRPGRNSSSPSSSLPAVDRLPRCPTRRLSSSDSLSASSSSSSSSSSYSGVLALLMRLDGDAPSTLRLLRRVGVGAAASEPGSCGTSVDRRDICCPGLDGEPSRALRRVADLDLDLGPGVSYISSASGASIVGSRERLDGIVAAGGEGYRSLTVKDRGDA